jgi:hypothetical protein
VRCDIYIYVVRQLMVKLGHLQTLRLFSISGNFHGKKFCTLCCALCWSSQEHNPINVKASLILCGHNVVSS